MSERSIEDVEKLAETLFVSIGRSITQISGTKIVLLVDPSLGDPLPALLSDQCCKSTARQRLAIDLIAEERCPYLIELDDEERVLSTSARLAAQEHLGAFDSSGRQPRSVCAWLQVKRRTQPPEANMLQALARRLAALAIVRSPVNGQRVMFRFWDPRLASDVARVLDSDWRDALTTSGAVGWWHISREGRVENLLSPRLDDGDTSMKNSNWTINSARWRSLESCGWRNRVAQLMPNWQAVSDDLHLDPEDLVARAIAKSLHSEDDVLQFAHCAVTLHPQFDQHPRVAAVLARMQNINENSNAFADHVRQWNEEFRAELRRGQWTDALNSQDQS